MDSEFGPYGVVWGNHKRAPWRGGLAHSVDVLGPSYFLSVYPDRFNLRNTPPAAPKVTDIPFSLGYTPISHSAPKHIFFAQP